MPKQFKYPERMKVMVPYSCMTDDELKKEYALVLDAFEACKRQSLNLNISRGKPASAQLDAVSDLLNVLSSAEECIVDGVDARNYGGLDGIPEAKKLFSELLNIPTGKIVIG